MPLNDITTTTGSSAPFASLAACKQELRQLLTRDPIDSVVTLVLGGAYLFYVAEKGKNPKIENYYDALVFVSTCMSVGYANSFAVTNAGKAIATAVMTFGPAISARALDSPA